MRVIITMCIFVCFPLMLWSHPVASQCRKTIPITETLVKRAGAKGGYPGDNMRPAFLLGNLQFVDSDSESTEVGTVVFLKSGKDWIAFLPMYWEHEYGIFLGGTKNISIFTMIATEGPGHRWTYFHSSDGLRTASCASLDFPNEVVNAMDFLNLDYFNIRKDGNGITIGSFNAEGTSETLWYRYLTSTFGALWTGPTKILRKPSKPSGEYTRMKQKNLPSLVKELSDYAKSKP